MSKSAPDGPNKAQLAELYSRGFEPVTGDDWLMMAIAALDVLLLFAGDIYADLLPRLLAQSIVWIDLAVLALFAIEFLSRMLHASDKFAYARNHWYDLVGMVPIAHVGLRSWRFVRLLRMYTVNHFPPEYVGSRSWMTALVRGVIVHYKSVLVEEISEPILLTSVNMIEGPLTTARFAATLGESLEERRDRVKVAVEEAVRSTRGVGGMLQMGIVQRLVTNVTDAVLDTTVNTLCSDEINDVISESIKEVLDEVREKVQYKAYREAGGGILRPVAPRPGPTVEGP